MKKIINIFTTILLIVIVTGCEDFNNKNFPGYEDFTRPKNNANYIYELTPNDFMSLGDIVKKTVETSISNEQAKLTVKQTLLKNATNHADSLIIQSEIAILTTQVNSNIANFKLDPLYIAGNFLKTNKFFNDKYPASDFVAKLLNSKYKYADVGSTVQLTYKYVNPIDTASVKASNKYTLTIDDYNALGEGENQPGQFDNFSSKIDPDLFIPRLLAVKYPLSQKGDIKMIRYLFYVAAPATQTYELFLFNGLNWMPFSKTEQFLFASSNEWIFDPTITFVAAKEDYLLVMKYLSVNDKKTSPLLEGYNEWTKLDTLKFVYNPKYPPTNEELTNIFTEFMFGTSWNYSNIDVRVISRTYSYDTQLQSYFAKVDNDHSLDAGAKSDAKTAFMEKRVKQGLSLMLSLKYPEMETQVKGLDQHVKINVQLFDGNRWYWTYNYKCVEKGRFEYTERAKWK